MIRSLLIYVAAAVFAVIANEDAVTITDSGTNGIVAEAFRTRPLPSVPLSAALHAPSRDDRPLQMNAAAWERARHRASHVDNHAAPMIGWSRELEGLRRFLSPGSCGLLRATNA